MKKKIIVILALFSLNSILSQNLTGKVIYKKEYTNTMSLNSEFLNKYKNNQEFIRKVKEIDSNKEELVRELKFELVFENNVSLFKVQDFLELENNKFYSFTIGPEGSIIYYTNQKNKENIKQKNAYGELFLVEYPMQEWELINETKKVGEYTCYKATTIKTVKGRKGIINTPVEAWYTPEIAIPFGPLGYNGLPGLIIELSMYNYKYYVSKIALNSGNEMNIKKPTQGKVVSKKEFEEIGLKVMSEFKKGL